MNNTERLCMGCMNDNGGESICPICGYDASSPAEENALPARSWIAEKYICGRVFEKSGENITYLGWDNVNNNVVYIKEYFPQGCCVRNADGSVGILEGKEYEFNNGLMTFLEISDKLSALEENSAVMPVLDTLELNGTAYSVIKAHAGITLREFLLRNGGMLKWEQARPLFLPLIISVEALHKKGIHHFGISPETIVVGRDGRLHLYGIAIPETRHAKSQFTSQLFPGFAAAEQYETDFPMGTHTDVYGMAATLFRVLIGNPPMAANERLQHDNMSIPAKIAEAIPPYVLSALANALQITPENRTATMAELRANLTPNTPDVSSVKKEQKPTPKRKHQDSKKLALIASAVTAGVLLVVFLAVMLTVFRDDIFGSKDPDVSSSIPSAPSVPSVGDVDPSVPDEPMEKLHEVPDFTKKNYTDILKDLDNDKFTFVISGTECSDTVPEGAVVSQTVKAGESVKRDTEIGLTISAGPAEIAMPNLLGKSNFDAYVELLELGFAKENIVFMEKYDETKQPLCVIETEVEVGKKISRYSKVVVFLNTYEGNSDGNFDIYTGSEPTTSSQEH